MDTIALLLRFGAGWLLIAAATGKLLLIEPLSWRPLAVVGVEYVAGVGLLSWVPVFGLPGAVLYGAFAGLHLLKRRNSGQVRCGCYGALDEEATFNYVDSAIFLILATATVLTILGSSQAMPSIGHLVLRLAAIVVPVSALGSQIVRRHAKPA